MKARKIFALSTLFAGLLNAGSIWNYTFIDYLCQSCAPVGFSFSRPAPIEIEPGRISGSRVRGLLRVARSTLRSIATELICPGAARECCR